MEAILQACIQVLLTQGAERLTTTRVAERAGVSVGTLYQYFPNKQSLLAAVLQRHLEAVVDAVQDACARSRGAGVATVAEAALGAFVDAKFRDPDTSRALYAIGPELGAERIVAQQARRAQRALADALAAAPDRGDHDDLELTAFLLSTAPVGPVQAMLEARASTPTVRAMRAALVTMATAYLTRGVAPVTLRARRARGGVRGRPVGARGEKAASP